MKLRSSGSRGLLFAMTAVTAGAQSVIERLSFGQKLPLSHDPLQLLHWTMSGTNHHVHMLSDRVILTPPTPGNARGALWAQNPLSSHEWTAELEFRASGQEGGLGNLQIWYTRDKDKVGTDSVYTVEKFDGLVLVLDQYGGSGGMLRGFLNDGSQSYRSHGSLESLAFGHCNYYYRNLGRTSKITISHSNGLTVRVDDEECFRTDKITLPADYYFGISAATGETPDSFEIYKFTVKDGARAGSSGSMSARPAEHGQHGGQQAQSKPANHVAHPESLSKNAPAISQEQFAELQRKVSDGFSVLNGKLEHAHEQVINGMPKSSQEEIHNLVQKVESLERSLSAIQAMLSRHDNDNKFATLQRSVDAITASVNEQLPNKLGQLISTSSPGLMSLVLVIVVVQAALAGGYLAYKRRRDMPKKYL